MTVTDPTEKPIYDAFLKHRTFIEKFQGGGERYVLDDYYEGIPSLLLKINSTTHLLNVSGVLKTSQTKLLYT